MLFNYPMIIHDEDGFWGEFPDIEGCNAQGDTLDEILEDARAALDLHILSLLMDGETLNKPSNPRDIICSDDSYMTIITVDVDLAKEDKSVKKNLTIPKWLNDKAEKEGINFSKTLQEALVNKLA